MVCVFVSGVAVVDFVFYLSSFPREAEKYRARDARLVIGGCGANAAIAVARLGGQAKLASRTGDDALADLIAGTLAAEGVDTGAVFRSPGGRSSFSSVYVDDDGERQIVNFRGQKLRDDAGWIAVPEAAAVVLADTRWTEGATAALAQAAARGIPSVLDCEAPMDTALLGQASHLAFSLQGLNSVMPGAAIADALRGLANETGAWVCVTDGANGAWFVAGADVVHVPAFAVDAAETLGAGDVWHGAFALRLAEGADEAAAVRFANGAAALKCSRTGGPAAMPDRAEVDGFLKGEG